MISGLLLGCTGSDEEATETLRLATTTSTYDSGLLDDIIPIFEDKANYNVQIISVGTGQALEIGRRGDADVLLVHALELELEFVEAGYGTERYDVMYNDLVIVGSTEDPAELHSQNSVVDTLIAIQEANADFVSRGDDSGTHTKEMDLWAIANIDTEGQAWYKSLGQGMGETLTTANEMKAYALTDRGTYLAMQNNLPNMEISFEGDENLNNPYGIIPVNPESASSINYEGAQALVDFFLSDEIQERIREFGKDQYGQPLYKLFK